MAVGLARDRRDYPERRRGAGAPGRRDQRRATRCSSKSTEPVAYSVSRPDALSLVVDMRNVSVADARADVDRQGAIAGVRLEQASARRRPRARTRARDSAKPSEYVVRSARNTIRVELKGRAPDQRVEAARHRRLKPAATPVDAGGPSASLTAGRGADRAPAAQGQAPSTSRRTASRRAATVHRAHQVAARPPASTTVTLVGNGHLAPAGVTESKDRPRRLVLDFPNVTLEGADPDGDRQPAREPRARRR